jgi:hypothetical protein
MAVPHRDHLNAQIAFHARFETVKPCPHTNIPAAIVRQTHLTPAQLAAQQNHNVPRLGAGFLSPHYYVRGTVPQPNDPMATMVNGFGLECGKHLTRNDGTLADPVYPPDCACGTWHFLAWGCGHTFCTYEHVCGRAPTTPSGKTRFCRSTRGVHHTAMARVLGPCIHRGCAWWAEREADIRAAGTFASLPANGGLVRIWPL